MIITLSVFKIKEYKDSNMRYEGIYEMREKNFYAYSQARKGLSPRALILNNGKWIIESILAETEMAMLSIVEIGFNHGNDSRYICEQMYDKLGNNGWCFYGYDYEKYFMPENLVMDEKKFPGINKCIKAIPCTLKGMSQKINKLPKKIDLLYSSKTLTLCELDVFKKLMSNICAKISENGFFVCSLHTKTLKDETFPTWEELYDIVENGIMFAEFQIYIQSNTGMCNFAFIAKKNNKHIVEICDDMFVNSCQQAYEKIAEEETDIFL